METCLSSNDGTRGPVVSRILRLAVSVLLFAWPAATHSQSPLPAFIGPSRGLPSNQVQAIAVGPGGFLWFAGPNGLTRYTGRELQLFAPEDGLATHGLRALAKDAAGYLWIGHDLGLDRWSVDRGFERWSAKVGWEYGFVEKILPTRDGSLWVAAADGLLRVSTELGLAPEALEGPFLGALVTGLVEGNDGTIWAASPTAGLVRFGPEGWESPSNGEWRRVSPIRALAISPEGTLLAGGNGLYELDTDGRVLNEVKPPWAARAVTSIAFRGNELWASIGRRLAVFERRADAWSLREATALADDARTIILDADQNVWVGTESSGVAKFSALGTSLRRPAQPCETMVYSIAEGVDGEFYFGGGLCSWHSVRDDLGAGVPIEALAGIQTWDLRHDRHGELWAATSQGVWSISENGSEARRTELLEPARALLSTETDFLAATVKGLYSRVEGGFAERVAGDGDSLGYVYTLATDSSGALWVGTIGNGLWREDESGELVRAYTERIPTTANVYSIAFDSRGERAVSYNRKVGLFSSSADQASGDIDLDLETTAWAIRFDASGRLWIGASDGLSAYDRVAGRLTSRIAAGAGLEGQEFSTSRSLLEFGGSELILAGSRGAWVIDNTILGRVPGLPRPVAIQIDGEGFEGARSGERVEITEGAWTVDVHPAIAWFHDEESVTFSYRMVGFSPTWQELPESSGPIRFTSLPAGSYSLEVKAQSPLGGESPVATVLTVDVARPWWWLPGIMVGVVALLGLGALVPVVRARALKRRSAQLEALVEQRTDELAKLLERTERLALEDNLTGLANRRRFVQELERMASRARRTGEDFCLVLADLDGLKAVNDRLGHAAGDDLLRGVARKLLGAARQSDLICRFAGDEFAVLAWESGAEGGILASRLHEAVSSGPIRVVGGESVEARASFGVCTWMASGFDTEALFQRADKALYRAKLEGIGAAVWVPDTSAGPAPSE